MKFIRNIISGFIILASCSSENNVFIDWIDCPNDFLHGVHEVRYFKDGFIIIGMDSLKSESIIFMSKDKIIKWKTKIDRRIETIRCFKNNIVVVENHVGIGTTFKWLDYKTGHVLSKKTIKGEKIYNVKLLNKNSAVLFKKLPDNTSVIEMITFNDKPEIIILGKYRRNCLSFNEFNVIDDKMFGIIFLQDLSNINDKGEFRLISFCIDSLLYTKVIPLNEFYEMESYFYDGKHFYHSLSHYINNDLKMNVLKFKIPCVEECKADTIVNLPFRFSIFEANDEYILIGDYRNKRLGLIYFNKH